MDGWMDIMLLTSVTTAGQVQTVNPDDELSKPVCCNMLPATIIKNKAYQGFDIHILFGMGCFILKLAFSPGWCCVTVM